MKIKEVRNFRGHSVTNQELEVIKEVVESCPGISRTELANTVCELLEWKRSNGRLKVRQCREYLEELEINGLIRLPERQRGRPKGTSYRSANWTYIGMSSGRGRMDREGQRHGAAPKAIFVYPLRADFRSQLKD